MNSVDGETRSCCARPSLAHNTSARGYLLHLLYLYLHLQGALSTTPMLAVGQQHNKARSPTWALEGQQAFFNRWETSSGRAGSDLAFPVHRCGPQQASCPELELCSKILRAQQHIHRVGCQYFLRAVQQRVHRMGETVGAAQAAGHAVVVLMEGVRGIGLLEDVDELRLVETPALELVVYLPQHPCCLHGVASAVRGICPARR
mmetsp:Transcript_40245/g.113969  ORF Transcript_40245/g.113969 Transcript_40245/m.113969 type:complete len:203 (+) Transcript_40245:211-819(+)